MSMSGTLNWVTSVTVAHLANKAGKFGFES